MFSNYQLPISFVFALCSITIALSAGEIQTSELWSPDEEDWSPTGRLQDFSYAGYHHGEQPIPEYPVTSSVINFGAVPDDGEDDTDAFRKAVAEVEEGTIFIPKGHYVLSGRVNIDRSGVVMRGAGPGVTILSFPKGLEHIDPRPIKNSGGQETTAYSWSGGFLQIRGNSELQHLATIDELAKRGSNQISVADSSTLNAGMEVIIENEENEQATLTNYLYAGNPGNIENISDTIKTEQIVRIASIDGKLLQLDRPLRYDMRPEWSPSVRSFDVSTTNSGFENFTVEFPARTYGGHFKEWGYNAFQLTRVADCWIKNVEIINADSGIQALTWRCTFDGLVLRTTPDAEYSKEDTFGHHGITIRSSDNLVQNFDFQQRFVHDLTVTLGSAANVFANGRGDDLCLDHHKRANNSNLFTNLNAGEGTRLFKSGGGRNIGRRCGAWTTFWNIRTPHKIERINGWSPDFVNFVGVDLKESETKTTDSLWIEHIPNDFLAPQDLHTAQLNWRMEKKH